MRRSLLSTFTGFIFPFATASRCNLTALDTTQSLYNITTYGTTIAQIANETYHGICDIGRHNLIADVAIIPNVGQSIIIPPQVCQPDNTSCILPRQNATRDCIYGGPRLYYTVNRDTLEYISLNRLNITVDSLIDSESNVGNTSATDVLEARQFIKIPQCANTQCIMQPYLFERGVYKDLTDEYGSTVGQIMMLSPTYNYSSIAMLGRPPPPITLPVNCTAVSPTNTALGCLDAVNTRKIVSIANTAALKHCTQRQIRQLDPVKR